MLQLALRQLQHNFTRSLLTTLALSSAVAVIIVLEGFEWGLYNQLRQVVAARQADLYVVQAGVANLIATRSTLPQLSREQIEAIEGVREAHPLTALSVIYRQAGTKSAIFLFVYDTQGGPQRIVEGRPIEEGDEIVLDRSLTFQYDLRLGDTIEIAEFEFTLAGITAEEVALFTPLGFITYDGLIDFYLDSDIAADLSTFPLLSYLLVEVDRGADPAQVAQRIDQHVELVDVYTPAEMMRNDEALGRDLFGPVIRLLIGIAYLIGLLLVGLIIHTDVSGRLRQYGVLKALGFGSGALLRLMWWQSALLLLAALPLGWLLAQATGLLIEYLVPLYRVDTTVTATLLRTGLAGLLFALLGPLLPIRRVARLDASVAFRSG